MTRVQGRSFSVRSGLLRQFGIARAIEPRPGWIVLHHVAAGEFRATFNADARGLAHIKIAVAGAAIAGDIRDGAARDRREFALRQRRPDGTDETGSCQAQPQQHGVHPEAE